MFTLTHLVTSPPEALKSQLLQMVVDYFSDISAVSLQPDNPCIRSISTSWAWRCIAIWSAWRARSPASRS